MTRRHAIAPLVLLAAGALAPGCTLDDSGTGLTFRLEILAQDALDDLRVTGFSPEHGERFTITPDLAGADAVSAPFVLDLGPVRPGLFVIALRGESARGTLVATRCYAITEPFVDDVLMIGPLGALDTDGDGFPGDAAEGCAEPLAGGGVGDCGPDDGLCAADVGGDCDDANERIFPGAAFPNTCQDGVDDDCDGDVDEACADLDADGFSACPPVPAPGCDCDDTAGDIHPNGGEICEDAVDQDCDGADAFCDRDGDGFPSDADCDDANAMVFPGASEAPVDDLCDGVDNDCNGTIDEHPECLGPDLDGDGVPYCESGTVDTSGCDCNDCDSGVHGANADGSVAGVERCGPRPDPLVAGNRVDDDCDGTVDEGCAIEDEDGDGRVPPSDCDDDDPLTNPQTGAWVERCGDGVNQNCVPGGEGMVCPAGDVDGDGFAEPAACEAAAAINPSVAEGCNAVDDDCDGTIDEVVAVVRSGGCARGTPLSFTSNFVHCGGCRVTCPAEVTNVCAGGVCDCSTEPGVGACAADGGRAACCPSGCADLDIDPQNCGACGVACGLGESCVAGRCACGSTMATDRGAEACPDAGSGESNACCAGACRDVTSDSSNCGACGVVCGSHSSCAAGLCQCAPPGTEEWRDCNSASSDGCETNVRTSEASCGACGDACSPPRATGQCSSGSCQIGSCDSSYQDCDGSLSDGCEINTATDEDHCGGCGNRCDLPHTSSHNCQSGSCRVSSCDGGYAHCDSSNSNGCETPLGTDTDCGGCGDDCGPNADCVGGGCQCFAGALDCNGDAGCETTFGTSDCGGCGVACQPGEGCDGSGRCTCGSAVGGVGEGDACGSDPWSMCCAGGCVDTRYDYYHCGSCGYVCGGSEYCLDGVCTFI